jgi:two-component system response regulator DesR
MVVEDQALVRGAVSALLGLEDNIEVVAEAENGKQALELIAQCKPDIVLTDIEMPVMNGIELIEYLRQHHSTIKTMVMTTFFQSGLHKKST